MAIKVSKDVFEKIAKDYARSLFQQEHNGRSYTYDAGVMSGIELAVYTITGYSYDHNNDKETSTAVRIKERAEELVGDWKRTDDQLNGEYTMNGRRVTIEGVYPGSDQRLLKFHTEEKYHYERKYLDNDAVLHLVLSGLLERYVEPEVGLNLDTIDLSLTETS